MIDEGREQSGNQKGGARDCCFLTERSNCTFTPGYTWAALDQILLVGGGRRTGILMELL